MNNDKNLNDILKSWDSKLNPAFEDPAQLKNKIICKIQNGKSANFAPENYFFIRKAYFYGFMAAEAMLIIFIGMFFAFSQKPIHNDDEINNLAKLSENDIKEAKIISSEVSKLFDDKISWICRFGDKMEIRPAEEQDSNCNGAKILVRQSVFRKNKDGWQKVYVADIITNPGEQVVFSDDKAQGFIWTYRASSNVVATDTQINFKINGETISLDYSGGQEENMPSIIKRIKNQNSEYIVCQTVNSM